MSVSTTGWVLCISGSCVGNEVDCGTTGAPYRVYCFSGSSCPNQYTIAVSEPLPHWWQAYCENRTGAQPGRHDHRCNTIGSLFHPCRVMGSHVMCGTTMPLAGTSTALITAPRRSFGMAAQLPPPPFKRTTSQGRMSDVVWCHRFGVETSFWTYHLRSTSWQFSMAVWLPNSRWETSDAHTLCKRICKTTSSGPRGG